MDREKWIEWLNEHAPAWVRNALWNYIADRVEQERTSDKGGQNG